MNKGKSFELDIATDFKNQGILCIRLNDSSLSWVHEKTARFTAQNPCDYIAFNTPYLYPIECKSTKYKSMSIQREAEDNDAMIKFHQWSSLVKFSQYEGVYPGFILNFRNDNDIHDNITYWLPIQGFSDFLCETDKKSINKVDCVQHGAIVLGQQLKRTHYTYDIKKMIEDINRKEAE